LNFWVVQSINGISYGMLLFLIAAGLSLIFGLMNILNLAHGSYYLLGAYIGMTVAERSGDFFLGIVGGAITVGVTGMLMQRFLLQRLYREELGQVLLTFGFLFIFADLAFVIWGGYPYRLSAPPPFEGAWTLGELIFPSYRVLVIAVGVAVAIFLWWLQERTRVGANVRAAVDDEEMAKGMGVNVPRLMTMVFGLGAALAALGGMMGMPLQGIYPGWDIEVLLLALVVLIIGGLGSLRGAFVAALLVGLLDNFGKALFPELSMFTIFAPMAIILAIKPTGIFGR
jgi:branched-chain amino acid transport system permease protein